MTDERDARMVTDPESWPRWPVLPLKRRNRVGTIMDEDYLGFIVDMQSPPYTVYVGIMYLARPGQKCEVYETLDDMLCEWRVD